MADFRHLTEARIREFKEREARGETRPAPDQTAGGESLEAQLSREIRALRKQAKAEPEQADELLKRASRLQTQLSVLLEQSGRPLAAQLLVQRLSSEDE